MGSSVLVLPGRTLDTYQFQPILYSNLSNIGIAQEVIDDGADDIIVFPGGEDIEAINDIIEDLVNSEELESSTSPTNISVTSKAPLFKTIVLRGPVDFSLTLSVTQSCDGLPDGTKCTKKCKDYNCNPPFARCWQGHCKRLGRHPCDVTDNHSCCCGDCYKPTTDPENAPCFQNFLFQRHKNQSRKKNGKAKISKKRRMNLHKSVVKV